MQTSTLTLIFSLYFIFPQAVLTPADEKNPNLLFSSAWMVSSSTRQMVKNAMRNVGIKFKTDSFINDLTTMAGSSAPPESKVMQLTNLILQTKTTHNERELKEYNIPSSIKNPALWSGGIQKSWVAIGKDHALLEDVPLVQAMNEALGYHKCPDPPNHQKEDAMWQKNVGFIFDVASSIFCSQMRPRSRSVSVYTSEWSRQSIFWKYELPAMIKNRHIDFVEFKLMPQKMHIWHNMHADAIHRNMKVLHHYADSFGPWKTVWIPIPEDTDPAEGVEMVIRQMLTLNTVEFEKNGFNVVGGCHNGVPQNSIDQNGQPLKDQFQIYNKFVVPPDRVRGHRDPWKEWQKDDCPIVREPDYGGHEVAITSMNLPAQDTLIHLILIAFVGAVLIITRYVYRNQNSRSRAILTPLI